MDDTKHEAKMMAKLERDERWEREEAERRAWDAEARELSRRDANARYEEFQEMKEWRAHEKEALAAHRYALEAAWAESVAAYRRIADALEKLGGASK